jgi:hypothetical protein
MGLAGAKGDVMKRALVVGIDDYPGAPLNGCVADAREIERLVGRNADSSPNYDVRRVTSDESRIERRDLLGLVDDLFDNAGNTQLLCFFAGHGRPGDIGAGLVAQDSDTVDMDFLINKANASPAPEVILILDCCFSGALGNFATLQPSAVAPAFRFGMTLLREGVTVLAASRSIEPAAETSGHGAFTRLLIEGLEGAAADHLGAVTSQSLYAFACRAFGAWDQRPVLKSYVTQISAIRLCRPRIEPKLLRRLPEYFTSATAPHVMSPYYEGIRPIPDGTEPTDEQRAFDYFKELRNAGLLTTAGNEDLYFVALASEDVLLTPLGQYFWRLAADGKL